MHKLSRTNLETIRTQLLDSIPGRPKGLQDYLFYNTARIEADYHFIVDRVPASSSVLDIGAVPPYLAAALHDSGFSDLTIADPAASGFSAFLDERAIKHQDVNLLKGIPDDFKGQFDFVVFNEVIEHLTGNILGILKNIVSCVKPGGMLMVTTPNLRSFSGLYSLVFARSGLASKPFETVEAQYLRASGADAYFGHVREYTAREVVQLLAGIGTEHVESAYQANYTVVPESYRERFDPFWKRRKRYRLFRAGYCFAARIELIAPSWRLFGKHLFRLPEA